LRACESFNLRRRHGLELRGCKASNITCRDGRNLGSGCALQRIRIQLPDLVCGQCIEIRGCRALIWSADNLPSWVSVKPMI